MLDMRFETKPCITYFCKIDNTNEGAKKSDRQKIYHRTSKI
jgi:hypothetical protein